MSKLAEWVPPTILVGFSYHVGRFCVYLLQMRIISRKSLRDYWEAKAETEGPLRAWIKVASSSDWENSEDVKASIPNARPIGNRRIIFPILRNRFRLIVAVRFDTKIVYVRFIGTHAEYNLVPDATEI